MAKKRTKRPISGTENSRKKPEARSKLERDLAPVMGGGDRFLEITRLLNQLSSTERPVLVTSYPASNAGME
ncbi:MAG: hypothetical protein WEC00_13615 [Dongiaceae bacterium]